MPCVVVFWWRRAFRHPDYAMYLVYSASTPRLVRAAGQNGIRTFAAAAALLLRVLLCRSSYMDVRPAPKAVVLSYCTVNLEENKYGNSKFGLLAGWPMHVCTLGRRLKGKIADNTRHYRCDVLRATTITHPSPLLFSLFVCVELAFYDRWDDGVAVRDRDEGHGERADRDLQGGDRLRSVPSFIVQEETAVGVCFLSVSRSLCFPPPHSVK